MLQGETAALDGETALVVEIKTRGQAPAGKAGKSLAVIAALSGRMRRAIQDRGLRRVHRRNSEETVMGRGDRTARNKRDRKRRWFDPPVQVLDATVEAGRRGGFDNRRGFGLSVPFVGRC